MGFCEHSNEPLISIKFGGFPIWGSAIFSRKTPRHGVGHAEVTEQLFRNLEKGVFCVLVTEVGNF